MANTTSYGIGQYRSENLQNKAIKYINNLYNDEPTITYYETNYRDIQIELPLLNGKNPLIVAGETYYVRLTVPQNHQYSTVLNLKLCPQKNGRIDTSRYQHIQQLIIPPTKADDDDMSHVILYNVPAGTGPSGITEKAQVMDKYHDSRLDQSNLTITYNNGELYYTAIENVLGYYYRWNNKWYQVVNKSEYYLLQGWKVAGDSHTTTITFDFVFSPKYDLMDGYSYLLLETDRSDSYQDSIQYINDKNNGTLYGTYLDKSQIQFELYSVTNLIKNHIQAGTSLLSHIAVQGHPQQLLAINGEEIKIGQSGFYELTDFTISSIGVVVRDYDKDRFIIDYEYRI